MKRYCKLIISTITIALIISLTLCPVANADIGRQRFGAWIASALQALSIFTSSTLGPYADFYDDYLSDPYTINEQMGVMDYIPYTWEDSDEFMERSVLKIDKDSVTIDGVNYTDVWLSTDAAEKFRTNAFDLISAFNIASQSEGTFASGAGHVFGIPIYDVNGHLVSPVYHFSGAGNIGGVSVYVNEQSPKDRIGVVYPDGWTNEMNYLEQPFQAQASFPNQNKGNVQFSGQHGSIYLFSHYTTDPNYYDHNSFDFDWVAGNVPADEPLYNQGLRFRVPTDDVIQWYQDYPDTGPNVTINMGDPELTQKVDDLIDLIIPLIPVLDIDFVDYEAPEPEPIPEPIPEPDPYPDPDPQPGTVIPDLDWTDLFQTIKNIFNKISEHVSISTAIKNILDKIKWFLDDFFGDLGDILNNLPDIFERHVIDTIRRGLTGLKNIFLPILALLRNALGIWHYVEEWFQAISTPFTFYLSVLGQGYPLITIPIYASIAGVIVIAVYRRFGR